VWVLHDLILPVLVAGWQDAAYFNLGVADLNVFVEQL
jgi:hypothetical protein